MLLKWSAIDRNITELVKFIKNVAKVVSSEVATSLQELLLTGRSVAEWSEVG